MASKREALISSAEKALQKGKVDAALKDYLKVLEETPADINILNKVGDLQVRLGKNDESIPFFLRIAEHYARDGFYVRAIAMYKKINKLDPARLDIYEKLAELYVKQQLWMEAKSNYQVLADYLLKQDNLAGAIGIYQKMVAIEPQNLQLHVKLADLFTQAKRIPEALREYAVVAAALSERGAHEESIRVYEKALKLAPDNVEILRTLVPLLLSINSVDQARGVLRKGLEASPRSVPLFLLSAEAALAANDMAEARSYSDKARAVEPENEEVLAAAVRIQLKGRRPDLAWGAAAPLADAALRRGESKKALSILVPIARAAPDNDELVKKIVDIAAGAGDEETALPFRSALAELYRKKGKVAEAADLLRLCARVQPDNAEFRARLAQLEPHAGIVSVVPARVPPSTIERHMEVTLSGFEASEPRTPAPSAAPIRPPEPRVPEPPAEAEEFEFDLEDAEVIESADELVVEEPAAAPPTPPRGFQAPPREDYRVPQAADEAEPVWNSLSAAEALEAYEARAAEAGRIPPRLGSFPGDEIEERKPSAELPRQVAATPPGPDLQGLDLALAPPEGFDRPAGYDSGAFAVPLDASAEMPAVSWASTALPAEGTDIGGGPGGPLTFGPLSRPPTGDTALEDALVEADVFRRYGLLEKAVDQLRPWLEREPANLRVREKLFEIHLEQGNRDEARGHAAILAEAYGASGREDRIRGLAALLGEPVREAPPETEEEEASPPFAASAPSEVIVESEALQEAPPVEEPVLGEPAPEDAALELEEAVPADLSLEELAIAADFAEPAPVVSVEPVSLDYLASAAEALEEPPTEVISAVVPPPSVAEVVPEVEPEAPAALAFEPEPPAEEAAPAAEAPAPVLEALPSPELATPAEQPVVPAPPAVPERRAAPKPKLSTEDILGLRKTGAPPAPRKPKAVRPEDVELDLLGAKTPKAKAKAPLRPEAVLPDDLLRSLRKPAQPAASPAATAAPHPAIPTEPAPLEPAPLETDLALPFGEGPVPAAEAGAAAPGEALDVLEIPPAAPAQASPEELSELDFCLDQGMVVDAAERLQTLEGRFPGDPELVARRLRLEGGRGGSEAPRTALHDILSDDLDSVLDASLGKALTEDMVRDLPPMSEPAPAAAPGAPVLDDSGLFSDEQEFFNFADELHTELRREGEGAPAEEGREVSLEEIFRDFKKGVEQQLSPEDYETHYNLGIAYKEMGLTDEAIGEFQLAAKDPLHAVECCAMLGLCFLEKGLPQLAVKWYRKGLETIGVKEDDRLGLQYALAGVFEQIGDREGAYRTYLDIFGSNAQYRDVPARLNELKPFVAS